MNIKITEPTTELLEAATSGNIAALDALLVLIQPGVYNLSIRVLGNREDAADATQEILLRVVTHLGTFRGQAAFSTWVWKVAHNQLMTARSRSASLRETSLEALGEKLQAGLDLAAQLAQTNGEPGPLTPEDKLEARQLALSCTQSMLMSLNREQRLIYILDTLFDLPSATAAEIVGITPEAYRQRLSRTRSKLHGFASKTCGLANPTALCKCEKQLPAVVHIRRGAATTAKPMAIDTNEMDEAERNFSSFTRVGDAAAVFRAHPEYQAPESLQRAIRAVLVQEGFLDRDRLH